MFIEVGKLYVTGKGRTVHITHFDESCTKGYYYRASNGSAFTRNGWTDRDFSTSDAIVREATPTEVLIFKNPNFKLVDTVALKEKLEFEMRLAMQQAKFENLNVVTRSAVASIRVENILKWIDSCMCDNIDQVVFIPKAAIDKRVDELLIGTVKWYL